jgi:type IV pilus assembly protein PilV
MTLIEVLISVLVMSVGVLGLATLQAASINYNAAANQRSHATVLAYDMADRMRANRQAALADAYTIAFQDPAPACAAPSLAGNVATQDISTWRSSIACRLPTSTGRITRNGNEFTLTVRWDDSHGNDTPLLLQFTTAL